MLVPLGASGTRLVRGTRNVLIIAFGWLTTFAISGGPGVPRSYGFFAVYVIASLAMGLASLMFMVGRPLCHILRLQKTSAIGSAFRYIQASGNHKGDRCKGVRCDFDLGTQYGQIANGHNLSPSALEKKVFLSICVVLRN